MRRLGLDVGELRIGVALSDPTGILASGLPTLARVGPRKDVRAIAALVGEHGVGQVVVGLPRRLDGSIGPQAEKVLSFVEALKRALRVPIVTWDERFSTVAAQKTLIEAGVARRERKHSVDKIAAILILQNFLDAAAASQESPGSCEH